MGPIGRMGPIGLMGLIGIMGVIGFALVGVSFEEAAFDEGEDLVVAEGLPGFGDEIVWGYFAGEAFDDDVRAEAFDEVDDEFDVIV